MVDKNPWNRNHFACYQDVDSGPLGKRVVNSLTMSEYNSVYSGGHGRSNSVRCAGVREPDVINPRNPVTGKFINRHFMYNQGVVDMHDINFQSLLMHKENTCTR